MNNKRPYTDDRGHSQPQHKKHKHDDHSHRKHHNAHTDHDDRQQKASKPTINSEDALTQLPPPTSTLPPVPPYTPFTVPSTLPPLPEVRDQHLAAAPFRHKSTTNHYNRSATNASTEVTYEKLEFLGDAQIEHLASRLLYTRFPHLLAGQQSQLRELLVKNETLAEYARAYGFEKRVQVGDMERMIQDTQAKGNAGNKGFNKVLGDVFEAYVAAVVLSHGDEGFSVAEKWMTSLWAPKLVEAAAKDRRYLAPNLALTHSSSTADPLRTYNPTAKAELQKLLLGSPGTKLEYEAYKQSVELKGDQLGQNKHFIAVYLTGYGYTKKLLGSGEGKNKVEAGNWAAQEAMHGEQKALVEECAAKLAVVREQKRKEKEEREAAEAAAGKA